MQQYGQNDLRLARNKRKILIFGGVLICAVGGVLLYRYRKEICEGIELVSKSTKKDAALFCEATSNFTSPPITKDLSGAIQKVHGGKLNGGQPFNVAGHIRNLPAGQNPSIEKVRIATELGVELNSNQTLVKPYTKNAA